MNSTKWLKHYRTDRSAVWIKCKLTNGEELCYPTHRGWGLIKKKCKKNSLFFEELSLQFKSHEVIIDIKEAEAAYFVRSVMGRMGGHSSQYYITGILKNGKMHKKMWLIPELVVEKELCDDLDECFTEAFIYNDKKKKNPKK